MNDPLAVFDRSQTHISVYNTCTLLLTNEKYNVDANLDAFDNVISGYEYMQYIWRL